MCTYQWTIKLGTHFIDTIIIGIDASNKKVINNSYVNKFYPGPYYVWCPTRDHVLIKPDTNIERTIKKYCGETIKPNDVIKMTVNTKDKTMKYSKNNTDLKIEMNNIYFTNNKKFNFALFMNDNKDFEIKYL